MKCADGCGRELDRHAARRLCGSCYGKRHWRGTHLDVERATHRQLDVLDTWQILRARGCVRREAADQLGMTLPAFERACTRARQQTPRPASAGRGQ